LIATIVGLGIYAACGRSRFAMVAPTSSSAAILAALLISMHGRNAQAEAAATVLAAAAFFLIAGVARAGRLANFISRPVLHGFSFGIAVTITAKQLPAITGVKAGGLAVLPLVWSLLRALPHWHVPSLLLGLAALAALLGLRRFRAVPGPVLVLAAGILLSACVDLRAWHVALVGHIALALPHPALPSLSPEDWRNIAEIALPLFLILFAESWSSIRGLSLPHGDKVSPNRELLALGCANLGAGLLQGMPVGAGFSASSAAEAAGAQSRLTGLAAMGCIFGPGAVGTRRHSPVARPGAGRGGHRLAVSRARPFSPASPLAHRSRSVCRHRRGGRRPGFGRDERHADRRGVFAAGSATAFFGGADQPVGPDRRQP
jgi:MFS superfamily sulfate permease-like transporter